MQQPTKWPDALDDVWAKGLDKKTASDSRGESLAAHTWEALSRLRDLARMRPDLPDIAGCAELWNVLFWAVFLHDWGKEARGFQSLLRGRPHDWKEHRHEVLSLAFIDWVAPALSAQERTCLIAAIATHHRDIAELEGLYDITLDPEDDSVGDLIDQLDVKPLPALWKWLKSVVPGWIEQLGFSSLGVRYPSLLLSEKDAVSLVVINGAEKIRESLALLYGMERVASPIPAKLGIILRGCMMDADHIASAHAGEIPELQIAMEPIMAAAGRSEKELYEHQVEAGEVSGSIILSSPTGSGKTEAALLWAAEQRRMCHSPRLFYVLPFQASMNAMYDRLQSAFPNQAGLLHGRSLLALYRRLMDDESDPKQAARLARWAKSLARLRYQPMQVLSPYQLLKAFYQVKGYEALLTDLVNGAFVMDEVHAYEPRRLAMIVEMISYLRQNWGACFFIMSATMPGVIRERVQAAIGCQEMIQASKKTYGDFQRHEVHLVPGDLTSTAGLERIARAYQEGKSVLVTCNTVARAQAVYRKLRETYADLNDAVILIHGRFNGRDRLAKERKIMDATGLRSRVRQHVIAVSTQVVEVSLNIDLDVLFTDPAPLEALLQRFGRINRNKRASLAPVYVFEKPADGQGIYQPGLVERSLQVIRQIDGQPVNENEVQDWLDHMVYTGEVLKQWQGEYEKVAKEFRTAFLDKLRPFQSDPKLADQFDKLFDGTELLPASLLEEYRTCHKDDPIRSSELLVPISWRQLNQLRGKGLVSIMEGRWLPVVNLPYSSEFGLEMDTKDQPSGLGD